MPIRLSALSADRRTLKVQFGDDSLTLEYRPSAINAVQEEREIKDKAAGRHVLSQARSLVEAIVSWDLVDDDGKPLPITEEVVGGFGLDVSNTLYRALIEDLRPNQARAGASSNGSSAASSAPAPSGT